MFQNHRSEATRSRPESASFEELLTAIVATAVAPLRVEIGRLAQEVQGLRRAQIRQLLTVTDAAAVLGVSPATVRRRIKDGTLRVIRVGSAVRIDLATLHVDEHEVEARVAALKFARAVKPTSARAPRKEE